MKPAFNVRQQSEIFIGPLADDPLSGCSPKGAWWWSPTPRSTGCTIRCSAQYDTVLIGLGESVKTMQTVEMTLPPFHRAGRRPFDLRAGGRGRHRHRRGGIRRIDLHARREIRIRLDDAAGPGRRSASGGKNGVNVRRHTRTWPAPSRSPQFVTLRPRRCCARCPTASSGPGWPRSSRQALIADARSVRAVSSGQPSDRRMPQRIPIAAERTPSRAAIRVKADIVERDERESRATAAS